MLEKIKNVLFGEDTSSYEITLQEMKDSLSDMIGEYNKFIELQGQLKENPKSILDMEFIKKEKFIDIMDKIKYKDIEMIKEYELYAMKYNILVELYKKLKSYVSGIDSEFILDFKLDKFKQPVAIMSQFKGDINKIILIKNTLQNEDYLYYKVGNNIEVTDICSKEPNVRHGSFMVEMLLKTINFLDKKDLHEIIVSKELTDRLGYDGISSFFKKQGFMVSDGIIERKIE